jgi:HAD superfamily hydrolase (TIGR01509 family)
LAGLLVDPEPLHCRAYQDTLLCNGATLTEAEYVEHWVRTGKGIVDWVSLHRLNLDPNELRAQKSKRYLELLSFSLRPMEGALELLEILADKKTLALASSSYPDAVDGVLQRLHLAQYFKVIVSGLDVAAVKPAPDIFLAAALKAGAAPSECIVLEDAEKGIVAAFRAGMRSIAVPNAHTRHHDFSKATRVCSSLKEITLEFLDALGSD